MSKIIDGKSDRLAELLKERDRLTRRLEEIRAELNSFYGVMIKQRHRENMIERSDQYYNTDMMGGDDHE